MSLFIVTLGTLIVIANSGADLTLDGPAMQSSIYIASETYFSNSCEINECLMHIQHGPFPITRQLLRFDTRAVNVGDMDFNLGSPFDTNNPNFVYDPCHRHYHFENFAEYSVYSVNDVNEINNLVPETGKRAFCLMDSAVAPAYLLNQYNIQPSHGSRYTCDNQGISVGYQDIYGANLDCQFVDITDLSDGNYKLVIKLNPLNVLPEVNTTNNKATLTFTKGNGVINPSETECNVPRKDWLGDGYCDHGIYNTAACNYDRGDCCQDCCRDTSSFICGTNEYNCLDPNCEVLETPSLNALDCHVDYPGWLGDGYCDRQGGYNTQECDWDYGDCCPETCVNHAYTCGQGGYLCHNPAY